MNTAITNDKKISPYGIVIISSLLDANDNIGTTGYYELLPIPWRSVELSRKVKTLISFSTWRIHQLKHPLFPEPDDSHEVETLCQEVGIQVWVRSQKEFPEIAISFSGVKLPRRIERKIQTNLDFISFHIPPDIILKWDKEFNEDCITALEQKILTLSGEIH